MQSNPYLVINLATQPPQTPLPVVANTVIFTEQKPFDDTFKTYTSSAGVENDFGTNSKTTKFAQDIFAQTNTIRSGGGLLYIVPMINTVNATSGSFTTEVLDAKFNDLKTVVDGEIKFTIDGTAFEIKNLNLTRIETLQDIVNLLNNLKDSPLANIDLSIVDNKLQAVSKSFGTTSTVVIGAVDTLTGTDLSGATYFNTATGVATTGTNASGETLQEAITRFNNLANAPYYGLFTTTLDMEVGKVIEVAEANQSAKTRMFFYQTRNTVDLDLAQPTSLNAQIRDKKLFNTRIVIDSNTSINSNIHLGALSILGSINWNGVNTHLDLFWKGLTNAVPSNILKTVDLTSLGAISRYVGTGEFLDAKINGYSSGNAFGLIWLLVTIEASIFNLLKTTTTKLPQTEGGVQQIKNVIISVLEQASTNGLIASGTWTGEVPYDDHKFRNGILQNGYYIRSTPIAEQSQADREQGKAPLINFAFKYAGAIIAINVIGLGQF